MNAHDYRMIRVADLVPHPDNPRDLAEEDPGEMVNLANSIAKNGNEIRIRVVPITDGPHAGKFLLVEGHRRRAAAELGSVPELYAWVDPSLDTRFKQIKAMMLENSHRSGLKKSREAGAVQTMLECEGMSVKKVAAAIDRPESFVRRRSRLASLPSGARNLVDAGQLTLEQSDAFDEFKGDASAVDQLLRCAQNKYETSHDWDRLVLNLRMRRDAPVHRAASEELIKEHKLTMLTENQTYSGHYSQIYEKTLSDEEHAEAGHCARLMEGSGKLSWFKKTGSGKEPKQPATDEEKAARRRLKDLEAGLEQDLAIWDEHLRRSITDAGGGLPRTKEEIRISTGLASCVLRFNTDFVRASELILGKTYTYGAEATAELHGALDRLRPLQLTMLIAELHIKPETLHKPASWDSTDYRWRENEGVPRWIRVRRELFGYELAVFEQEAMEHFIALAKAGSASSEDDQEEDDEDD